MYYTLEDFKRRCTSIATHYIHRIWFRLIPSHQYHHDREIAVSLAKHRISMVVMIFLFAFVGYHHSEGSVTGVRLYHQSTRVEGCLLRLLIDVTIRRCRHDHLFDFVDFWFESARITLHALHTSCNVRHILLLDSLLVVYSSFHFP